VLAANGEELGRFVSGESRLRAFFMGEVMRLTHGRADPSAASLVLDEELGRTTGGP
jgi:Asp-tRNA(Asn)/Glu-tRNA(Gln) amidotransferase B subunit